jgi:hypothetical protein
MSQVVLVTGVIKSADEPVTNSATLQDDDELNGSIAVGETWEYEWLIFATGDTAGGDIKFQVTVPANCVGFFAGFGTGTTAVLIDSNPYNAATSLGSPLSFGTFTGETTYYLLKALIRSTDTGGAVTLQWAQNTIDAATTTVKAGSCLRMTKFTDDSNHIYVVKDGGDETVTSSTTLQDDDELVFAVGANETWEVEVVLHSYGSNSGDLKSGFTVPTGAVARSACAPGFMSNAGSNFGAIYPLIVDQTGSTFSGLSQLSAVTMVVRRALVVTGGTAGNVQLQWAQNTSNGTGTVVKNYSYLKATRVSGTVFVTASESLAVRLGEAGTVPSGGGAFSSAYSSAYD